MAKIKCSHQCTNLRDLPLDSNGLIFFMVLSRITDVYGQEMNNYVFTLIFRTT